MLTLRMRKERMRGLQLKMTRSIRQHHHPEQKREYIYAVVYSERDRTLVHEIRHRSVEAAARGAGLPILFRGGRPAASTRRHHCRELAGSRRQSRFIFRSGSVSTNLS